jgi:hypothetical protein
VRGVLRKDGEDPLGDEDTDAISKKRLDAILSKGEPDAAAVIQSAVETYAGELSHVIRRFLRQKSWKDTQSIVFGGGFRSGRVGELALARTRILLREADINVAIELLHNHTDEAGLIGTAHLLPPWMVKGHDAMLAVDIGGTNIRVGIVRLNLGKKLDLSKAYVEEMELWRHGDEDKIDREDAVGKLCSMLEHLVKSAGKTKLDLAPVIGIGCPGRIAKDGNIEQGAQNLPGNWESSKFNLPHAIRKAVSIIGGHEAMVVMHNDAVVQGLSELPNMQDYKRWGVLTIGTGLGNARFTRRAKGNR